MREAPKRAPLLLRYVLLSDDQGAESELSMDFIPELIDLIESMFVELRSPVQLIAPADLVVALHLINNLVRFFLVRLFLNTLFLLEAFRQDVLDQAGVLSVGWI